ncbi:MAG: MotA/TolQ/ExbB proton channel family protein [Candidatus Thiodiazotropha sp.]
MQEAPYLPFLRWLLLAGLILFGLYVAWDLDLLSRMIAGDRTRISLLILGLFGLASCHCAWRSFTLSREHNALSAIIQCAGSGPLQVEDQRLRNGGQPLPLSLAGEYLAGVLGSAAARDNQLLAEVLAEQARGQHEAGWFATGLLVKLGLLGTVVGFVMMLGSVAQLDSFDVGDVQQLLQHMTGGMGVALNTTLLGLTGSMLLGMQYLLLDRAADRLVARAVQFAELYTPAPESDGH